MPGQQNLQRAGADLAHDRQIERDRLTVDAGRQLRRRAVQCDTGRRPGDDSFTGRPCPALPLQFSAQARKQVRWRRAGGTFEHDAAELAGVEREAAAEVTWGREVVGLVGHEDHLREFDMTLRSVHSGISLC